MMQKNPTFRGAEPTWANACVGNNGQPSYIEYSTGFSKAANILIDQVLEDGSIDLHVDEFVYPVCFNMRHSVELRLKGAIEEIVEIAKIKNINLHFDSSGSHDINSIWKFFQAQSEAIDSRYAIINSSIEPTILDIAQVDPTGQTFRYPFSNTSQKHLTDVSVINFVVLKKKFNELEKNLDALHELNSWLRTEYWQGTFTSKLSRPQIFEIASRLPRMNTWRDEEFAVIKECIKAEYELGSRDFSKVIDIIKAHYSLAPMVGEPLPIKGISEGQLLFFIEEWVKASRIEGEDSDRENKEFSFDHESFLRRMHSRSNNHQDVWSAFSSHVSEEYLAGLEALFYFSRDKVLVEYYTTIYENHLRVASVAFKSKNNLKDDFMHIFTKTNALDSVLISLYALGHINLAESIVGKYELERSLRWLEDARTGCLFAYPDFAGY